MPSAWMPSAAQTLYILKIIMGLLALCLLIAAAAWLPESGWSVLQNKMAVAVLLLLSVALIPIYGLLYRRSDELQRLQHQQASVQVLGVTVSVCTALGILQASEMMPLFNQFWTLGLLIAVWGAQLMSADRRYR